MHVCMHVVCVYVSSYVCVYVRNTLFGEFPHAEIICKGTKHTIHMFCCVRLIHMYINNIYRYIGNIQSDGVVVYVYKQNVMLQHKKKIIGRSCIMNAFFYF